MNPFYFNIPSARGWPTCRATWSPLVSSLDSLLAGNRTRIEPFARPTSSPGVSDQRRPVDQDSGRACSAAQAGKATGHGPQWRGSGGAPLYSGILPSSVSHLYRRVDGRPRAVPVAAAPSRPRHWRDPSRRGVDSDRPPPADKPSSRCVGPSRPIHALYHRPLCKNRRRVAVGATHSIPRVMS